MPSGNIHAGKYDPAMARRLKDDPWYLVADPNAAPAMTVGFLNGRETPFVESADVDFNHLGMQMRVFYDYGIGDGNNKALVRAIA